MCTNFSKARGTVIVNDAADFTGTNGCYLYQGRDVKPSKKNDLKDQMLVLAPHEGIVPADIWLACRKKLMNNMKIQSARKATPHMAGGENQVRELRICAYEYLQSVRQAISPLVRNGWTIKAVRAVGKSSLRTGSGGLPADGEEAGKAQDADGQGRKRQRPIPKSPPCK